jgi:hypothetical protein
MSSWKTRVNELVKEVKAGKEIPMWENKDTAIRMVEFYRDQYSMEEENMTFSQAEKHDKNIKILEEYVYNRYPDYKEKVKAKEAARLKKFKEMEENGEIQTIHFNINNDGSMSILQTT